jgi:peroxiredoxin
MRCVISCTLIGLLVILESARADPPFEARGLVQAADRAGIGREGEVAYIDGRTGRVTLQSAVVELETKYGKLVIPAADIERIDFAFRLPDEVAKKVAAAVKRLSSDSFEVRDAASKELLAIGVHAYPALETATRDGDVEVARRAALVMRDIRAKFPGDQVKILKKDHIETTEFTVSGRITSKVLRVRARDDGEKDLKLADLRTFQLGSDPRPQAGITVGKLAAEIDGEDIDGKRFKLSNYRGKVVLLVFWGNWCPPCRASYPQLRALVSKFDDRWFVAIGVNSDKDRDAVKKTLVDEKITWRSFWNDGSTNGAISRAWSVAAWPTFFLIDHKGVIRTAWRGMPPVNKLDEAVEPLVKEADRRK